MRHRSGTHRRTQRLDHLNTHATPHPFRPRDSQDESGATSYAHKETILPTIHHGDCIETMNAMPPESIDAIVTDPPYGLGFMGKKWDGLPPSLEWAEACYRVLKPGGHIVAFGGTRTWHRLAVAIEDAGFEMRDSLAWLYGSGFPKSMNVGKAIDKAREDSSEWRTIGQALRSSREAAGYRTRRAFAPLILDGHKNLESAAANLSNWENG